ncbi:hypothetical protein PG997_004017 [Apiospora hydei]|uniref:Uncharacterized protein n=1 Tax=Apiospora hydei TaxID=1337664 RepID=A0ABR1X0Y7_9PEZI
MHRHVRGFDKTRPTLPQQNPASSPVTTNPTPTTMPEQQHTLPAKGAMPSSDSASILLGSSTVRSRRADPSPTPRPKASVPQRLRNLLSDFGNPPYREIRQRTRH